MLETLRELHTLDKDHKKKEEKYDADDVLSQAAQELAHFWLHEISDMPADDLFEMVFRKQIQKQLKTHKKKIFPKSEEEKAYSHFFQIINDAAMSKYAGTISITISNYYIILILTS